MDYRYFAFCLTLIKVDKHWMMKYWLVKHLHFTPLCGQYKQTSNSNPGFLLFRVPSYLMQTIMILCLHILVHPQSKILLSLKLHLINHMYNCPNTN